MTRATRWAALAAGAWLAWWAWKRREVAPGPAPPAADVLDGYRAVSPVHHAAYARARDRFADAHQLSYQFTVLGKELVEQMFAARDDAAAALGEIRMRLPNDLDRELAFVRAQEAVVAGMAERIEDAKRRLRVHVHPGPMFPAGLRAIDDRVA